jgi:hypothetical protein
LRSLRSRAAPLPFRFARSRAALLEFPAERPIFLREYTTGTYRIGPYVLAKVGIELCLLLAQTLVQYVIVYFMVGFQGNFILMVLVNWALGLTSNGVGILIGSAVDDVKTGTGYTTCHRLLAPNH